jgi:hypothetical protein
VFGRLGIVPEYERLDALSVIKFVLDKLGKTVKLQSEMSSDSSELGIVPKLVRAGPCVPTSLKFAILRFILLDRSNA